jgi:hypothetical protein
LIDKLIASFKQYCSTGRVSLTKEQSGYLVHCVSKASLRGGHPIFLLMALEGCDMSKLEAFVKKAERKAA